LKCRRAHAGFRRRAHAIAYSVEPEMQSCRGRDDYQPSNSGDGRKRVESAALPLLSTHCGAIGTGDAWRHWFARLNRRQHHGTLCFAVASGHSDPDSCPDLAVRRPPLGGRNLAALFYERRAGGGIQLDKYLSRKCAHSKQRPGEVFVARSNVRSFR
jgi:hypothetical protein